MMDIALLTANASQLRYVMRSPYWDFHHKMNIASAYLHQHRSPSRTITHDVMTLWLTSHDLSLQILAGVLLVFVSRKDYKRREVNEATRSMNDVVVVLIFSITFVNIFIATFGIDDEKNNIWTMEASLRCSRRTFLHAHRSYHFDSCSYLIK